MNCWFHKWGKWVDTEKGDVSRGGKIVGVAVRQERRCERCNKVQLRTEEARINEWRMS